MENNNYISILRKCFGVILIILGIFGIFLPFLQGILMILVGGLLLGINKKRFKKIIKNIENNISLFIPLRYLIALGLVFTLQIIYQILTPLTTYYIAFILNIFYNVTIISCEKIIINFSAIEIIPSCVAGSAYILLLILNLTTPMKLKKRLFSILFSVAMLFLINTLRLFILTIMVVQNSQYFDIVHKLFWYLLSTIFVIGIWFLTVKLFNINEIPVYSDAKFLIKNIRHKTNINT